MSPVERCNSELERVIADLALRIIAPRESEFDAVWDIANAVCDRYDLGSRLPELKQAA